MVPESLLTYASQCYDFDKSSLQFISDSTNQIYLFKKNNIPYILRFSKRPKPFIRLLQAEMEWIYYLANNGVNVSLPLLTVNEKLLDTFCINEHFYIISAFEMACGQFWNKNDVNLWNEDIFYKWGKTMADIHVKTKSYEPDNVDIRRDDWSDYVGYLEKLKTIPSIKAIANDIINKILSFPRDIDSYGLIHYDMHQCNFLIDNGKINVFDFDDSIYGWYALDIGVALYHALWLGLPDAISERQAMAEKIIYNFMDGYLTVNKLDISFIRNIPLFIRYRQISAFCWFFNTDDIIDKHKKKITDIQSGIIADGCEINNIFNKIVKER